MRNNDVGAWLLQETWEEGDEIDIVIRGYHIFCHNAQKGDDGRGHLFWGVAIILSPFFMMHGEKQDQTHQPPLTAESDDFFVGRFIQLNVKFDLYDTHEKKD